MTIDHPTIAAEALRDALDDIDREIDSLGAKREMLAAALDMLAPLVRPPNPAVPAEPVVLPKVPTPAAVPLRAVATPSPKAAAQQARAAQRATCPECGKDCSLSGLGAHRRFAHEVRGGAAPAPKGTPKDQPLAVAGLAAIDRREAQIAAAAEARKANPFSVTDATAALESAG